MKNNITLRDAVLQYFKKVAPYAPVHGYYLQVNEEKQLYSLAHVKGQEHYHLMFPYAVESGNILPIAELNMIQIIGDALEIWVIRENQVEEIIKIFEELGISSDSITYRFWNGYSDIHFLGNS